MITANPFRRGLAAAIFATAVFSSSAQAQDISASHIQAARAAIDAINATDPFDNILPQIAEGLKVRLIANNPDIEDAIVTFVDDETIEIAARRADLETEAAMIYARAFAEEDLVAIANFYNSAAGMALLENGAIATREVSQAAAIWQRGISRDLESNVSDRIRESGLRASPAAAAEGEGATEGTTAN